MSITNYLEYTANDPFSHEAHEAYRKYLEYTELANESMKRFILLLGVRDMLKITDEGKDPRTDKDFIQTLKNLSNVFGLTEKTMFRHMCSEYAKSLQRSENGN